MDPENQLTNRSRRAGQGDAASPQTGSSSSTDDEDKHRIKSRYHWHEPAPDLSNTAKLIIVAIFIGISILFVKYMDSHLPSPLTIEDSLDYPERFIEERARMDLYRLTVIGPRIAGSEANDVHEVAKILEILKEINMKKSTKYNLEVDQQFPTGAYHRSADEGHTSSYSKIVNVIAKLEPEDPKLRSNDSVLFNCHFDTKLGSPGATDDIISCATMLEMLRVLSANDNETVMPNTLLFLFNGAEELGLKGAHGFAEGKSTTVSENGTVTVTTVGHKWASSVKAFVNLEGAGAGGREILFQSGPGNGWILTAYTKNCPHPYGLVIAEEAFQRNFIPSDTDYRIFRDYLGIPGLDMAFIKNGWVYHTKWDKLSEIPPGSIQHMGDNALALATHFGHLDLDGVEDSSEKMVFFDLFGAFMIAYTETVGIIINFVVGAVGIGLAFLEVLLFEKWGQHKAGFNVDKNQSKIRYFGRKSLILLWLLLSTILAWGLGALVVFLVALVFSVAGYDKPFYSYPTLSFIIFGIPCILTHTIVYSIAHKGSVDRSWMGAKFTFSIILIVATFITRIVYVLSINLLFGFLGFYIARLLVLKSPLPKKNIQKLVIYLLIGELIPFTIACYLTVTLADVFIPILGRSGSETNPNIYFGLIISSVISIIGFHGLSAIFVSFKKSLLVTALLYSVLVINPLVVFGFIGKIPYQEKTPMRINVIDVDRIWYNSSNSTVIDKSDSAYWFWQVDSGTMKMMNTFEKTVYELHDVVEISADTTTCEDLHCALSFLWPETNSIKKTPMLMKNGEHAFRDSVNLFINSTEIISPTRYSLLLTFQGPAQTTVVLSPGESFKLANWSLSDPLPPSGKKWHGRETYFISHGKGVAGDNIELYLELERVTVTVDSHSSASEPSGPEAEPLVDVLLGGHFLFGEEMATGEFNEFAARFPSWTYVMNWSAVLKMYKIPIPPLKKTNVP